MSENMNSEELNEQLVNAVRNRESIDVILDLLIKGASPIVESSSGSTALYMAAFKGYIKCLELFLENGVDVNENNGKNATPLYCATVAGRLETCEFLIQKGADTTLTYGEHGTVLHVAAMTGRQNCYEYFLDYWININVVNDDGDTPLHSVARLGRFECSKFLLKRNADVNIMNNYGETPILCLLANPDVISNKQLKICKLFFEYGAVLYELPERMNEGYHTTRYNSLKSCWKWWEKQQNNKQELIDIPMEIFYRGSEAIDIYFHEIEISQNIIHRSRICVVGPSGWGKTSLIKSLISSVPTQVPEDLRTIGIDQFQWRFDVMKENNEVQQDDEIRPSDSSHSIDSFDSSNSSGDDHIEYYTLDSVRDTERHQICFWDFAGQDVYQGAHSIFFSSSRTLFLICVNLQLYDEDIQNECNTASDEILKWIRLVFAKQPGAKLVFVGTKADLVNEDAIQDIQDDLSDCVQEWCEKYSKDITNRQSLLSDKGTPRLDLQQLQMQLISVKNAVHSKWVITSSIDEVVLNTARGEIQSQIRDNDLGFIMPDSYIAVLDYLHQLQRDARPTNDNLGTENANSSSNEFMAEKGHINDTSQLDKIFCSQRDLKRKIRRNVQQIKGNDNQDVSNGNEIRSVLDEILDLFHDLGEILLFSNISLNRQKGVAIVDPGLMIDLVRDIVRHDLRQYLEHCNTKQKILPSDWKDQLKNGIICHTIFPLLPIWSKLTSNQRLVAKKLLNECQVLHPIGDTKKFESTTNVVVPSLWFLNYDDNCNVPHMQGAIARRYADANVESRLTWEYEFSVNTLPDPFFELFVVESYHYNMERIVKPNSLEVWTPDTSTLGLVMFNLSDSNHHIIKIEIASTVQSMAVQLLKYILTAVENLLHEYPGVSKTPYTVESMTNELQIRHVVNGKYLLGRFCSISGYNWLDENLYLWYYKEFSVDLKDLQRLVDMCEQKKQLQRQNDDMEKANIILQNQNIINENLRDMCEDINARLGNLSIMDSSHREILKCLQRGEKNRQLPVLWTAELKENERILYLRLLSDVSGKCFHAPIRVVNPLRLLSMYANKLKIGENLLSNILPNTIPWKHLDISNKSETPKTVYNLIRDCNLQAFIIYETENACRMGPEESKLFLKNLLKFCNPKFTLDQISSLSGLVCGVSRSTGHQIWATEDEIAEFGDNITLLGLEIS